MRFDDNPLDVLVGGGAKLWMLLVGVNQYQDQRLVPLSFAVSDCQGLADALAKATQSFPDREVIIHCDAAAPTSTREAIRTSLQRIVDQAGSQDTVLFYFSGHGMVEPTSKQPFLCLAETQTDNLQNTGLGLQELLQQLRDCGASKQLVMLDACHSGSIGHLWGRARGEARQTQSDPTRELKEVLRRRADESGGFCALLSCDEGQRSWEFPDLEHGVFTYYLMQGLQGEATDARGMIEAKNLYNYVYTQTQQFIDSRMRQLRPPEPHNYQQTPRLIISAAGSLVLGFRPEADDFVRDDESRLRDYRKKFNIAIQREYPLSQDTRQQLQQLRQGLGLREVDVSSIEGQIIAIYEQKLQQYEVAFARAIHQQYPLSHEAGQALQRLQQEMNLSNNTVASIEQRITTPLEAHQQNLQQYKKVFTRAIHWQYPLSHDDQEFLANLRRVLDLSEETTQLIKRQVIQGYEQKLQQYEAAFTQAIHQQYPLSHETRRQLQQLQQGLDLRQEIIDPVEARVTEVYEQKLQQYEVAFARAIRQQYSLSDSDRKFLANLQQDLNLAENQLDRGYEQKLQQYEAAFTQAIHQQYPLSEEAYQPLQLLQHNLGLGSEITESIEARVTQAYEQKLQQYETAFTRAVQRQYPLKDDEREFLASLRQSLSLNQKITDSIEELEYLQRGLNLSEKDTDLIEQKVTETYSLNLTPTVDSPAVAPPQAEKHQKVRPLLPRAMVVVAVVGVSILAHSAYSLWQADKSAKVALEQTQTLKAEKNYDACLSQAAMIPQQSRFYTDAQNLRNQCQSLVRDQQWLSQAKAFAAKNNLKDAIAQANGIRSDSSFHPEAQQLISQWSETLLKQAEAKYIQSDNSKDLESAVNLTRAIPLTSSVAQKVEEAITKWRTEWNKNETYLQGAQVALNQGQWGEAIEKANQVKLLGQAVKQETPYWQNKIQPIIARAGELRAASAIQVETTRQFSTQQPDSQQPTTQQSTTRQSASRQSSAQQPTTQQSSTQQPTTQRSSTRQSASRRSTTRRSSTQRPTTQPSQSGNWPTDTR